MWVITSYKEMKSAKVQILGVYCFVHAHAVFIYTHATAIYVNSNAYSPQQHTHSWLFLAPTG